MIMEVELYTSLQKKSRMIIKINYILIPLVLTVLFISCKSENCKSIEQYENGLTKTIACIVSVEDEYFCFKDFDKTGNLQLEYCLLKGEKEGERLEYYQDGTVKSSYFYKDGLRHGLCTEFLEDGNKDFFNYYIDDKPIYGKFFRYDSSGKNFEEIFSPIIEIMTDTVSLNEDLLKFKVNLPVPNSLSDKKMVNFMYDLKPISLKDSTIYTPKYEVPIRFNVPYEGEIEVKQTGKVVFYGYIAERNEDGKIHAFSPFEKEILVLEK